MPDAVRTTTSHSGAASRSRGSAVSPSIPGMERSRRTRSGCRRSASDDRLVRRPIGGADDVESVRAEQRRRAPRGSADGRRRSGCAWPRPSYRQEGDRADKGQSEARSQRSRERGSVGQILLAGLLGRQPRALPDQLRRCRTRYELPQLRLVAPDHDRAGRRSLVALLAAVRFSVEGRARRPAARGRLLVSVALGSRLRDRPTCGGGRASTPVRGLGGADRGAVLGPGARRRCAPLSRGRSRRRDRRDRRRARGRRAVALLAAWWLLRVIRRRPCRMSARGRARAGRSTSRRRSRCQALVNLVAVIGWGERFGAQRDDLARWLALGFTLMLFSSLHLLFQPHLAGTLRLLRRLSAGARLSCSSLVGAWRAIRFGRVRPRGGRGAGARGARDPRRARPVPVRRSRRTSRCSRRERGPAETSCAAAGGVALRAAGGALCRARALVGGRARRRSTPRCSAGTSSS